MSPASTEQTKTSRPFVEEIIDNMLAGWSGLRHYVLNRRAGSPADPVMESLLTEWVRCHIGRPEDVRKVVDFIAHNH